MPKLRVKKRKGEWWILGVPDMDPIGVGPYGTQGEAEDDMHGLERFYKYGDRKGYIVT